MLNEKIGNVIDGIFSLVPFAVEHGGTFCIGILIGVVMGCFIALSVLAGLKIDDRLENPDGYKRGDKR